MAIYVALLRGINVGGKNRIKMSDLKSTFETVGLHRVQTYIQSGNVLFESDGEEAEIRRRIEREMETVFGFAVTVVLRTAAELADLAGRCPFSEEMVLDAEASAEGESLYVSLLTQAPSEEGMECLRAYKSEGEEYRIEGREVFLLFRHSIRNSKLANNLQKLEVPGTVRNWKTISKLAALAKAMEMADEKKIQASRE